MIRDTFTQFVELQRRERHIKKFWLRTSMIDDLQQFLVFCTLYFKLFFTSDKIIIFYYIKYQLQFSQIEKKMCQIYVLVFFYPIVKKVKCLKILIFQDQCWIRPKHNKLQNGYSNPSEPKTQLQNQPNSPKFLNFKLINWVCPSSIQHYSKSYSLFYLPSSAKILNLK